MVEFFDCAGGCHIMRLEYDDEEDVFYLCVFGFVHSRIPWRTRFRHIWNILRFGTPYSDHIVFSEETAESLADTIKKDLKSKDNRNGERAYG